MCNVFVGDGVDDEWSDGSPIASLYRKPLNQVNKRISKSRLKEVGSSAIDFDGLEGAMIIFLKCTL